MRKCVALALLIVATACAPGRPVVSDFCTLTGGAPPLRPETVALMSQDEVDWMLALVRNGEARCAWR